MNSIFGEYEVFANCHKKFRFLPMCTDPSIVIFSSLEFVEIDENEFEYFWPLISLLVAVCYHELNK